MTVSFFSAAARISTAVILQGVLLCVVTPADELSRRPPNVVMILADDLGSLDLQCYGAKDLTTPNLDKLAARGVRFTQFYAAAPVCSPSRAAFITGQYPQRAGVPGNVSSQPGHDGLPASTLTAGELFAANGYLTGHVGKWHLGYSDSTMPQAQGFASTFGHMGGCIDNYSHFFYWNGPNRHGLWRDGKEVWHDGEYFPELMAADAIRFVQSAGDQPFFLYWALNIPHYPLQGTAKWRKHYAHLDAPRRMYAALVSTMDEVVGRFLNRLEELHPDQDTIIIFQSDHGHSTEVRTFGGGGFAGPYRGAKFSLFEGGIRVPAIISWPQKLPTAAVRHQMATGCDWLPTLVSLCGLNAAAHRFDGRDLSEIIHSAKVPSPHTVFHWQSGGGARNPQWAVRKGRWKLIANPKDTSNLAPLTAADKRFLVDLDDSVRELKNLASQHPEIVAELEELHNQWLRDVSSAR